MTRAVDGDLYARMVEIRRDLHRHPELSWQEERTAARVAARLTELGIAARQACGTGLVADIGPANGAPRVALRADLDALPIQEETARPHEAIDAVVVGSLVVMSIQTIVSREIDPAHPSVVTVGRFDAGSAGNVIAGGAVLEGTVRAQDQPVREHLLNSIRRVVESVGQLHQAMVRVDIEEGTPRLVNAPHAARLARQAARQVADSMEIRDRAPVNMGGEDFAHFLLHVPGCYVRFGAQVPGLEGYPAHSSRFDFDEEALAYGASWFHRVALAAGRELRRQPAPERASGGVAP